MAPERQWASEEGGAALDGDWYEQLLGQVERRRRGHYSTPPALVARVLEWVGYRPGAALEQVTLLDPACGSGNFLVAAAAALLAHGREQGWPDERMRAVLETNLWGLEADPAACALAEMRLQRVASRQDFAPAGWETGAAPPTRVGMVAATPPPNAGDGCATPAPLRFHVHQADALALAAAPRFQIVVGNPPYLTSRKHPRLAPYQGFLSHGQRDAYLLFVEQACRFVAPGGWLGLVLPDPVLARANAASARQLLLGDFMLVRLEHLAGVFGADVGTVVLIAQRAAPPTGSVFAWRRVERQQARQQHAGASGTFSVEVWRQQTRAELRYLLGPQESALFARLAREVRLAPLGDLVRISRGEEIGKRAAQLRPAGAEERLPVLRGGQDVLPFRCRFVGASLPKSAITKPLERYQAPKLLVVKSTGKLCAALDASGAVAVQTLYLLHRRADAPALEYLLALLNSRLLRGYLWLYSTAYKLVQPQIEQEVLARVPVPLGTAEQQQELAALAVHLQARYGEWDEEARRRRAARETGEPCMDKAGWIQLGQMRDALTARLDVCVAALGGLSAAEQALLARLPTDEIKNEAVLVAQRM